MKIRTKDSGEGSRCRHGMVIDLRGQDQPADSSRAQQVLTAQEPVEPRRRRDAEFGTRPSRRKHHHRGG
jgi:hypothetical protein